MGLPWKNVAEALFYMDLICRDKKVCGADLKWESNERENETQGYLGFSEGKG